MNYSSSLTEILEKSSIIVIVLDTEGVVLQLNAVARESLIHTNFQIGTPLQNFTLNDSEDAIQEIIQKVASGVSVLQQHVRFPTNSSEGILTLFLDFIFHDDRIYAIGSNITEEDKEQKALQIISKVGKIAAWYYNPMTKELFWSKECYKMHGIDPNDAQRDEKGFHNYEETIKERAKKYLFTLLETKKAYDYVETVTKNDKTTYLRITAEPVLHDDTVIFVNGTVADITERQEYLQKLRYSEETQRLALKGIRSGLFDHHIESDMVYYSPSFRRMLGLSLDEEFLPEPVFRKMIHPDDAEEAYQRHLDNLEKSGNLYFNHYRLRHVNGEYRYYEVYGYRKKSAEDRTERMIGNLIDVNERKKNELLVIENQQRMRAMINNGFVYTFLLDREGNVLITDDASAKIIKDDFEVDPNATSVRFINVLPLNFKHTFAHSFNEALKGHTTRKEIERVMQQGNSQWLEVKYTPIFDLKGTVSNVLITGLDISERKIAEIAIKEAHLKEQELHSLKTNILTNFSHEIRTPLNGIMAISELLLSEEDADERTQLLQYLKDSKDRLLETINNISSYSEVETMKANIELIPCDLNFTVESSFREYDHLAELKQLNYTLVLDKSCPKVNIDEELFRNAFNNIIHNAIKYTHQGAVTIRIFSDADKKESYISVKDTGIGIATEHIETIFEPFVQESTGMSRKYEGTGIGLSLSKRYIEILDGRISVESELHQGTEFIITLPLHL